MRTRPPCPVEKRLRKKRRRGGVRLQRTRRSQMIRQGEQKQKELLSSWPLVGVAPPTPLKRPTTWGLSPSKLRSARLRGSLNVSPATIARFIPTRKPQLAAVVSNRSQTAPSTLSSFLACTHDRAFSAHETLFSLPPLPVYRMYSLGFPQD